LNARTWISIVNLVAIVLAFVVLFELPQYSTYAFYGLLGWILASFVLLYALRVGRTTPAGRAQSGGGGPTGSSGASGSSPLPFSGAPGSATTVDFCIYCGTTLPAGAAACPNCGRAVRTV
jgi:hypothetical protein